MKELKDISWQVDEPTYRADTAYSYSTIARFNREGFNSISKLFEPVESTSLIFGSVVDTLCTGTKEELENNFFITNNHSLSDQLQLVVNTLYDRFGSEKEFVEITDDELAVVGEECDYYKNPKFKNTRIKNIRENCAAHYNSMKQAQGKTVISTEMYNDALECAHKLKTSPNTATYFITNLFNPNIKNYYQLKFKGTYNGINLRCMADIIQVDYSKKTIQPIDLKTSFHREWDFADSFVKWNYYIQAQLYWYIIRQNMNNDEYFKDFKLLDYKFIVISNGSRVPLVWEYLDTQVEEDVCYGKNKQYVCRNWRNIVKEMDYYLKYNPTLPLGFYNKKEEVNDIIYWLNEK